MLWKEVPHDITKILEGANPITDTCHSVAKQVREAVIEAIPSYDDLMLISKRLEEHEITLKRITSASHHSGGKASFSLLFFYTLIGSSISLIIFHYFSHLLP